MALLVTPNDELQRCGDSSTGAEIWSAQGSDPTFKISYSLLRQPIVIVSISAIWGAVDPKIYINRRGRFAEQDALCFPKQGGFVFILDVGRFGSLRTLRIDPASFPIDFEWRVESFEDSRAGMKRAQELIVARPGVQLIDVGRIPRFTRPMFKLPSFRRKKDNVETYLQTNYALAATIATPVFCENGSCWLSVVVPVYNTPVRYLDELLGSFRSQEVKGIELILSDDASTSNDTLTWLEAHRADRDLKVVFNLKNQGIAAATNAGLQTAQGQWVTFLDHDDLIAPNALKVLAAEIEVFKHGQFFFTDEVVVDDRLHVKGLMLKPSYDPVLLSGVNFINHFSIYRRSRLEKIGFLRLGFDGSQDYDLLLRYLEGIPETEIRHIPYPAYWWRHTGQSYSAKYIDKATNNARKAIIDKFARSGKTVEVLGAITSNLHRVSFQNSEWKWPKISIIIPSKNSLDFLVRVLDGIFSQTDYPNFEVIVVDNGSDDDRVLELYRRCELQHSNFTCAFFQAEFNFSHSVNRGVRMASGEHVLLLNNDIEIIERDWLKEMVQCLAFQGTGIVGAKLLYPDDTIQHAGVIVGFGGLAGHWYSRKPKNFGGPMNRLHVRNSMSCVTGAAMLISGDCLKHVGPWDEVNFPIAYNDVDYCLRAGDAGYRIVWTPFACLYHHESVSRGSDATGAHRKRFERDKERLRSIHATSSFRDPAINPGYSIDSSEPLVLVPERLFSTRRHSR